MKFKCIYKNKFKTDFILNEESFKCEDGKYRYLYKIEFPNGKYYLGKHTTKDLNDGYGGSGSFLPKEYAHNDTILMLDVKTNNIIKEFYDCIEAIKYVKKYINEKASGSEIFVACRENKIRYNHKWKQIKK